MRDRVKKISVLGILLSLALILSYVDSIVSGGVSLPGIKLGLSNLVIVIVLYIYGFIPALAMGILKSLFSLIWLGHLSGLIYSLCGIVLSVTIMAAVKKAGMFSVFGVSVSGAVSHTIGQIFAASLMLRSASVWNIFPMLSIISCISGVILAFPEYAIINFLNRDDIKCTKN